MVHPGIMSHLLHLEVFTGKVDRAQSVIRGVSLISTGAAKGHDMDIDSVTLGQVMALFPATGLKAKINHRDSSGVRSINGRYKNPRIEGGKFRADWHVLDKHPDTEWLFQLAEEQPEDCGISLTCKAGTAAGPDGRKKMRIHSLKSGDLVDDPAANESLLEAGPVDTEKEIMELAELVKLVKEQNETLTQLGADMKGFKTFQGELTKALGQAADDDEPADKNLAAITKSMTELTTKVEAITETIKTLGQKPAPAAGTDKELSTDSGKTAEEKVLEGELKVAKETLDKAFGLQRTELAAKYEREFGEHWKTRLVELEAKPEAGK